MTKKWRKSPKYSESFKKKLVRQVIDDGYSPLEVARRHDIGNASIYRWLDKYGDELNGNFELNQFSNLNQATRNRALVAKITYWLNF